MSLGLEPGYHFIFSTLLLTLIMFECKDQSGRNVFLQQFPPNRIVSLVPSQTELLYDLGLNDEVTGITKFCVHPEQWFKTKKRVGGTKHVNIEKVKALQPDLVLANKEENVKEQIEALEEIVPVWVSDVATFEDALQMITGIGEITNRSKEAATLVTQIVTHFKKLPPSTFRHSVAYLIWREPYMAAGGDTFISDMLNKCGLLNVFENEKRYPQISIEQLAERDPEVIVLSSEPYPFQQKHANELTLFLPNSKIMLVDGEMFSWYGSRMLYAASYFAGFMQRIEQ
jgi:ABC-type Fe3+-hydroxamate transport system substrate-binding protein